MKFLIGFFYFSGWKELYESLQITTQLKILAGLQLDNLLSGIVEHIHDKDIEVAILDEAHNFRNQGTTYYEALMNVFCNFHWVPVYLPEVYLLEVWHGMAGIPLAPDSYRDGIIED